LTGPAESGLRITIDSALSFNFTKAAEEKNAENLLIIRNKELAEFYIDNWNKHKNHSDPYLGR
jgi:hypothetical protein